MKIRFGLIFSVITICLTGCVTAPQRPLSLTQDAISTKAGRIGVVMTALPKQETELPGASCLLCLAAATMATSSLTTYAQTLPYEDLPKLKNMAASLLSKKGADVVVIEESLDINALTDSSAQGTNVARKDFSPLMSKYKIDRLLVIDISALGFIRTYSSYFPTSDPKSLMRGTGYLVNLKNNTYEWYLPVLITKSSDKNWDEPPKYPGLTNAYFQVLEMGKDTFLAPLSSVPELAATPQATGVVAPVAGKEGQNQRTRQ